jgi:hypothetical protein
MASLIDKIALLTGYAVDTDAVSDQSTEAEVKEPMPSSVLFPPLQTPATSTVAPEPKLLEDILKAVLGGDDGKVARLVAACEELAPDIPDETKRVKRALSILRLQAAEVLLDLQRAQGLALSDEEQKFKASKTAFLAKEVDGPKKELVEKEKLINDFNGQLNSINQKLGETTQVASDLRTKIATEEAKANVEEQAFLASIKAAKKHIGALVQQLTSLQEEKK